MRVIINADDFGLNAAVNAEIERCIKEGLITSTTIMAAGDGFEEAVEISKHYPNISFGVHLSLDELTSLTKSPILYHYGLTDGQGLFMKGGVFKVKEWTKELKEAVFVELSAQIEKIIMAGIKPSHFDGHHHCHTIPALHEIIVRLSSMYSVKKVRIPLDFITLNMRIHHIVPAVPDKSNNLSLKSSYSQDLSIFGRLNRMKNMYVNVFFFKRNFTTSDYCCSVASFRKNENYMLQTMRNKTIELMCHPGHQNYLEETESLYFLKDLNRISYIQL